MKIILLGVYSCFEEAFCQRNRGLKKTKKKTKKKNKKIKTRKYDKMDSRADNSKVIGEETNAHNLAQPIIS